MFLVFLCLWVVGCLVSCFPVFAICSILGFDEETQVTFSIIIAGLLIALVFTKKIMGG